ncbi:hypothetical protein [Actinophytocola sp. KF-1]
MTDERDAAQDAADERLLARLRETAAEYDPVPEHVLAAARAALGTRRMDEELAALVADSALADTGVRAAAPEVRLLTFESAGVSLELQVEYRDDRVSVRGLVTGATGEAVVEVAGERHAVPIDDGWFAVTGLPRGATRVTVPGTTTSWVSL